MAPATEPCAVAPVRSWLARVLALLAVEPFAVLLEDVPVAVELRVAPVLVPVVLRVDGVGVRPDVVDGVHGAASAPVCTPGDLVPDVPVVPRCDPWLDRVDGDDVDGDDVLPVDWAIAGTASARLSAMPPAHVIHLLFM
jgi:hypothetical protein